MGFGNALLIYIYTKPPQFRTVPTNLRPANADIDRDISSIKSLLESFDGKILIISPISTAIDEFCSQEPRLSLSSKPLSEQRLHKSLNQVFLNHDLIGMAEKDDSTMLKDLHILIADDQRANLKLLNILLTDLGANVKQAKNGEEAIQHCESQRFDIVFMDIQMPVIDGIKATETIKASSTFNHNLSFRNFLTFI